MLTAGWRARGTDPVTKLTGRKPEEYRPWHFQVNVKLRTDYPLFPTEQHKVEYALTQMTLPIFPAMQEWVIANEPCTFNQLLEEIKHYMGVHLQERQARKALEKISQKSDESVTEYYHRISALWNLVGTPEVDRIEKFITTILPRLSTGLVNQSFDSIREVLDQARLSEERKKDIFETHLRNKNKSNTLTSTASTRSTTKNEPQSTSRSRPTGSYPNVCFGPVAKKPVKWIGDWFEPESKPRRLTEADKTALTRQGRCWSCHGSGHRSADDICPFAGKRSFNRLDIESLDSSEDEGDEKNSGKV